MGLAFVKGLAFSQSLPTVGINTLDVVAAGQSAGNLPLVCTLPAGRGRLAVCTYINDRPLSPAANWRANGSPSIMTAEALNESIIQDSVVCGDLNITERLVLKKNGHIRLVSPALSTRRPAILAELAYTRWQDGDVDDVASLAPLYLHIAEPIPDGTSGASPV